MEKQFRREFSECTCEAAENVYVSKAVTVASVAESRRLRIQRHAKGRPLGEGGLLDGWKASPRFIMANRTAFHSLLHQWRYATTLLMSRFTLLACTNRTCISIASCAGKEGGMADG